jgi:hypothetical protein
LGQGSSSNTDTGDVTDHTHRRTQSFSMRCSTTYVEQIVTTGDASRPLPKGFFELMLLLTSPRFRVINRSTEYPALVRPTICAYTYQTARYDTQETGG